MPRDGGAVRHHINTALGGMGIRPAFRPISSDVDLAEAKSFVGGHLMELDPVLRTVHFRKPGVRINLGSIGKGYALDICAAHLRPRA